MSGEEVILAAGTEERYFNSTDPGVLSNDILLLRSFAFSFALLAAKVPTLLLNKVLV